MKKKILILGALTGLMVLSGCAASDGSGYRDGGWYPETFYDTGEEILALNETYKDLKENPFMLTESESNSFFSMDSSTASYSNLRRFIQNGIAINPDAIKTDELINYFDYNLPFPTEDTFNSVAEIGKAPWSENQLLTVGITSKKAKEEDYKGNNLVFLIDVSGSMSGSNRIGLVKESMKVLVESLTEKDNISIVTYASGVRVVANGINGKFKTEINDLIDSLIAGGGTNGQGGIEKAYEIIAENYIEGGNNRIIIASDGDFNVGASTTGSIADLVKSKLDEGVYVTCLGFGMGNFRDDMMEEIAKNGNGGYYYIDSYTEAEKVFKQDLGKTLYAVSKDTKTKVAFNKDIVKAYRLIGYENKTLTEEDFETESKDAGEVGSGHTSMVCYELVLQDGASLTDDAFTLDIHYKDPQTDESKAYEKSFAINSISDGQSDNFQFVSSIIEFSLILRDSPYKGTANYADLVHRMENIPSVHVNKEKGEFFKLVFNAFDRKLIASESYDQTVRIQIDFGSYYVLFLHEKGTILKSEEVLLALGYGRYSKVKVELFYDRDFNEPYMNTKIDEALTLFGKVTQIINH